MKICILGLDGADLQVLLQDERLGNFRRLMELGSYGILEGVQPPGPIPGWICLAASQDPGSLGIYGLRGRRDRTYSPPVSASPPVLQGCALWDQVQAAGGKSMLFGLPPNFPPRPVSGISIGCFLTPDPAGSDFVLPAHLKDSIRALVGEYAADIKPFRDLEDLRSQIFEMSRQHWEVVRWLLREKEWTYFHFVDRGLNRVLRAFWSHFDPQHPRYRPGGPYQTVIPDYYLWLDEQLGSVLELLDQETALLLASTNGMQRLESGLAVNQWLQREGLLSLRQAPGPGVVSFDQLNVNWERTRAWSDDGPVACIYFNLAGREPQGIIPAAEYEAFCDDIETRLQTLRDSAGRPLPVRISRPSRIYRETRNLAPDLMVQFADGRCSAVGSIGHPRLFLEEMADTGQPTALGMFILTAPNCPLLGEFAGAHLLDMAPTLLDVAGYPIPASMQGRSLVAGMEKKGGGTGPDNDQIILDRLAGLGYV